jgi:pimeloyl-ACP methyl ester carboxylesterase
MAERRRHRQRWAGALIQARVPLRLVIGMQDPIAGGHMLERYRELLPKPDTVALEGLGHYPQVEAPEHVLAAVLPFLTG